MSKMDHFQLPLKTLDTRLQEVGLRLKLVIVGAFALNLLNISGQFTADIDSVDRIENPHVLRIIADIAVEYQLPTDWINDAAASIDLPDGFFTRVKEISGFKSLELFVGSRIDIIALKARAYLHRGEFEKKDLEDLQRLAPTKAEIDFAIDFVRLTSTPPEPDLFPEFESVIT
jgi:hypothetical protein